MSINWDLTIKAFSALATPAIAIGAIYVAAQQWRIQEQKLTLDLYDRRLKVYEALKLHLSSVVRKGSADLPETLEFWGNVSQADFLFGNEIPKYLDSVYERSISLWHQRKMYDDNRNYPIADFDPVLNSKQMHEDLMWLANQLKEIKNVFKPYLAVYHVKPNISFKPTLLRGIARMLRIR